MREKQIGYIAGNPNRQKILDVLQHRGLLPAQKLAKAAHIPRMMTQKILVEMQEHQLVKKEGDGYMLTDEGAEVLGQIHGMEKG